NFAAYLQNSQDINETASELGFPAFQSAPLNKEACSVGGGLNGGRELVVWAVSAEVGDVAKRIFTVGDNYVVAQVVSRTEEGVQPLEDVRDIVAGRVRNQKKAEMIRERLSAYAGQDLNAMQTGYGEGAFVNSAQNISFSSPTIPNVGADPIVIGKAIALSQGETSGIIEGQDGMYVVQVTGVTEAEELDEASLGIQRDQAAQQGRFSLQSAINNALIEMSTIDDNRIAIERRQYNVN
ncbi:MAG: peptidylprolyl isomerase, partial [Bacteroidota bacterium]